MESLNPYAKKFILHWGEMSSRWGINRSMAQIHALLYLSERPLHAEEIAKTLSLARSNVSGNLRELQAWGVIRVVHLMGDRRDHFQSMHDAWDMLVAILEQRKRREIDPTIETLRRCLQADEKSEAPDEHTSQRMRELLELLELVTSWYEQMVRLPRAVQETVLHLGGNLRMIEGAGAGHSPADDANPPADDANPPADQEEA